MRVNESNYTIEEIPLDTPQASPAGQQRFAEAKFGISTHWGLYSLLRRGEWVMYQEQIPYPTYRGIMERFNPTRFDAEEWGDLLLEAGARFFSITSKHHDGFCLWDTDLTDFKVTNTAFKRDIIAELATALHDRGIGLHFYYSLVDWTHPAYREDWPAYVAYYQGQLHELLTRYGQIDGVLFDGFWPRVVFEGEIEHRYFAAQGNWDLAGTYQLIHQLQPDAVVANNSHIPPLPGEDCQVWEIDMPGENTVGFNTTEIGDKQKAVWWNLNTGWAYFPASHTVKSAKSILTTMRQAFSYDAAFILNLGPRAFGDIHPEEQLVLRQLGQQLRAEESWQTTITPLGLDAATTG